MFRGQPPLWVTGGDYCCQPHIRRELNGREPPPARAPYNSAFVRCFAVSPFPSSPAYVRGSSAWGEKKRRQKEDHRALADPPYPGVGVSFREKTCSFLLPPHTEVNDYQDPRAA